MIVKLTSDFIANKLLCPEGRRRIEYVDKAGGLGLYILVSSASPGVGCYYVRWKQADTNKTCHQRLGRTTDIDLETARDQAKQLRAAITLGANPQAEAKARKAVPTLTEFFEEQYLVYVKPRKRSWKKDKEMFRLRIKKAFGHKRLNQIRRQQIQIFHTALKDEGLAPATANHYVKLLRHLFNLAVEWEVLEKNPASRIPLFFEDNQRDHYLDDDELQRLLGVLHTDKNRTVCLIALFLLSTGARLNEALQSKWTDVDKEARIWRIPASNSKSKRTRSVPLNDSAIDVLDELDTEGKYDFLFISKHSSRPLTTIQKVWQRLRKEAGLEHVNLHLLRHSYASYLSLNGRNLTEIATILGHRHIRTVTRYIHANNATLQAASACASDRIKGASNRIKGAMKNTA